MFTLLTPLLSASPLAVPSLAQYDDKQHHYHQQQPDIFNVTAKDHQKPPKLKNPLFNETIFGVLNVNSSNSSHFMRGQSKQQQTAKGSPSYLIGIKKIDRNIESKWINASEDHHRLPDVESISRQTGNAGDPSIDYYTVEGNPLSLPSNGGSIDSHKINYNEIDSRDRTLYPSRNLVSINNDNKKSTSVYSSIVNNNQSNVADIHLNNSNHNNSNNNNNNNGSNLSHSIISNSNTHSNISKGKRIKIHRNSNMVNSFSSNPRSLYSVINLDPSFSTISSNEITANYDRDSDRDHDVDHKKLNYVTTILPINRFKIKNQVLANNRRNGVGVRSVKISGNDRVSDQVLSDRIKFNEYRNNTNNQWNSSLSNSKNSLSSSTSGSSSRTNIFNGFNQTTTTTTEKSTIVSTTTIDTTAQANTTDRSVFTTAKDHPDKETSASNKNGYIIAVVTLSLVGAVTVTLIGVLRCLKATRRASGALALPIPLLPEDRTPLNAEPEHPVPMLSVQSPGCAGMERLGVPVRSSLGSPPDDRSHISRRMRVDAAIQARDILVRDTTILSDRKVRDNYHSYHIHSAGNTHHGRSGCPPHIPLPDGEYGQDRDLQIRTACQQTEITRSYIKPPPNKTVLDVPEQSYNLFPSSSSLSPSICLTTCNLGNFSQQQANNNINHRVSPQEGCPVQQKSKPNVLKKFLRQISPKMPSSTTASSASTSSSSNSTLSSASSSYSSSSPPLSLSLSATALTTTNCNLGTNLVTLGTSTSSSVSGTQGPVSVSVPASVTIPVTMPAASLSTIPQTSMSISNIQCLQHSESSSSVTIAPPTTTYSTTINSDAVSFINNNHQLSHRDNI